MDQLCNRICDISCSGLLRDSCIAGERRGSSALTLIQYVPPRPSVPVTASAPVTAPAAAPDPVERLKELAALHDAGALSDEEFAAAKRLVLAG